MPSFCLMLISDIVVVKKQCHYTNIFKPFRLINELIICREYWYLKKKLWMLLVNLNTNFYSFLIILLYIKTFFRLLIFSLFLLFQRFEVLVNEGSWPEKLVQGNVLQAFPGDVLMSWRLRQESLEQEIVRKHVCAGLQ